MAVVIQLLPACDVVPPIMSGMAGKFPLGTDPTSVYGTGLLTRGSPFVSLTFPAPVFGEIGDQWFREAVCNKATYSCGAATDSHRLPEHPNADRRLMNPLSLAAIANAVSA